MQRDVWQGIPTPAGAVPGRLGHAAGRGPVLRTRRTGSGAAVPRVRALPQTGGRGRADRGRRRALQVEDVAVVRVLGDVRPGRHARQARQLPAPQGGPAVVAVGRGRGRTAVRGDRGPGAGVAQTVRPGPAPVAAVSRRGRVVVRGRRHRVRLVGGRVARVFARVRQEGPADAARVLRAEDDRRTGAPQAVRPGRAAAQEAQVQSAPVRRPRVVRGRAAQAADGRGRALRAQRARAQRVRVLSRHAARRRARRVPDAGQGQRELFRDLRTEVSRTRVTAV